MGRRMPCSPSLLIHIYGMIYFTLPHFAMPSGRRESFDHVQAWFDRAKQLGGQDIEPVLIGNKIDLEPTVRQV